MTSNKHLLLLGTHDTHIHAVVFDSEARTLTRGASTVASEQPSWLARHPDSNLKDLVYVNGWVEGKLFVYRLLDDQGHLELLSEVSSGGKGPTHFDILPNGSGMFIAHYVSGTVTFHPLDEQGLFTSQAPLSEHIFTPSHSPLKHHRQDHAHVHQIVLHKDEILVPDLGSNKVWRLKWVGESFDVVNEIDGLEDGDGPRHCVVHPHGTHIYVVNELSSQLTIHTLPKDGPSQLINRFSMLPEGDKAESRPTGASEIILLPPTRPGGPLLLITSNRDSPVFDTDTLSLFSVSSTDGADVRRTEKGWMEGIGRHLRGVGADESKKWVAVLGRDGGGLKIFERDGRDGLHLNEVTKLEVENTVMPLWVN
ncbi:hypothetical protein C362_05933 [Cryptococcus neoformans Bt1]|nr:hypothetical protein C362_05933 [Cryptococcus neoformans var. grubii Bt1]OXG14956.1 hypothetical protein C367_05618 [Cryptococcus neoformans var. grubii Ze90-1]